jgi:putative aldouronate transport system substrate-binding protein
MTYGDEGVHWKKGADGFPEIIDQEKYKNEVTSNNDYRMLFSPTKEDWSKPLGQNFDLNIPLQKEAFEKYKEARKIYLDTKKQYSELTHSEHMPQMPIEITETAGAPSVDFSQKAIVSGNSYSVDQAIKDMKEDWEKNNGKKKEQWMQQWYEKEKNNAFLAKDMYDVLTKQSSMLKYRQ